MHDQQIKYSYKKLPDGIAIVMLFVAVAVFNIYLAGRGVDLTDQGLMLALEDHWQNSRYFPIIGSVYVVQVIHDWLSHWSYFTLKLIATQTPLIILLIFYFGLRQVYSFNNRAIAVMAFLSIWAGRSTLAEWSYYSTFSGLLLSLAIVFLVRTVHQSGLLNATIACLALYLACLIKITNLLFLLLLPVGLWFLYRQSSNRRLTFQALGTFIFIAVILLLALAFTFDGNFFQLYQDGLHALNSYSQSESSIHSLSQLLARSGQDLLKYFYSSTFFVVFIALLVIPNQWQQRKLIFWQVFCLCSFMIAQYYFAWFEWNGLFVFYLVTLLIFCLFPILKQQQFLLLTSLFLLIFNSVGSGNGLKAAFIAEPLCCYVIVYCFFATKIAERYVLPFVTTVIALLLIGVVNNLQYTYRDLPSWQLTRSAGIVGLNGVYSNSAKIEQLKKIATSYSEISQPVENALIYPSAPLLHYILRVKPFLSNPWPNIDLVDRLQNELKTKDSYPNVVIRLNRNPRSLYWPADLKDLSRDRDWPSISLLDEYVQQGHYRTVYESEVFTMKVLSK